MPLEVALVLALVGTTILALLAFGLGPAEPEGGPLELRVRRVVAGSLGLDPRALTPTAILDADLGLRSVDLIEVAPALEAQFGVVIPEHFLRSVRTYGDLEDGMVALAAEREDEECATLGLLGEHGIGAAPAAWTFAEGTAGE